MTEVKPDGSTGKTFPLIHETTIGRASCDVIYSEDALLSPRHAALALRGMKVVLRDLGSQNGTFTKQRQDAPLASGDVFLLGRELFRFSQQASPESVAEGSPEATRVIVGAPMADRQAGPAKLEHIQLSGEMIEEFKLEKSETMIGRTTGDMVFKNDPYMSGAHASIVKQGGRYVLQDKKSRNGIYRKIRGEAELRDGDEFFLGEQLFRVGIRVF